MGRRGSVLMSTKRLVADLAVDRVLSLGQIERYYALKLDDLAGSGLWLRSGYLVDLACAGSRKPSRDLSFVSVADITDHPMPRLAHQAGTAETRRLLGAPRSEWVVEEGLEQLNLKEIPDAIWDSPEGVVLVEYDAGYRNSIVRRKLEAYTEAVRSGQASGLVWSTPSPRRTRNVENRFSDVDGLFATVQF